MDGGKGLIDVDTFLTHEGIDFVSHKTDSEHFFSWAACECCGDYQGGDRETIRARHLATDTILEFDVCVDCFVALCE